MKLKKKVIAKITKIELGYLEEFTAQRRGLIRALGAVETDNVSFWGKLKKEYNFPKEANNKVECDKKTRELYYEKYE